MGPRSGILIVEDNYLVAAATSNGLRDSGYDVLGIADSADEAFALAQEKRPLLILMDVRLAGDRDGIDAGLEIFRSLGIRCIFATAYGDAESQSRAEPARPLGWLPKPYAMPAVIAAVADAVATLKAATGSAR